MTRLTFAISESNPESSMLKGFRQLHQISSEMLDIDESLEEVVVNEGKLH